MPRFPGNRLVVATHNLGKLEEIRDLLAPFSLEVVSAADLGLAEPEETEDSFIGNARLKARAAVKATGLPALADDSGLCVDALGGDPGVRTADWAEGGNGRDFGLAMRRTRSALIASGADAPWFAQFRCTLVLALPDDTEHVFEGVLPGQVVWPMRGEGGHGYDPVFQPDGFEITFAEMESGQKNLISHRAQAFRLLVANCFT